MRVMSETAKIMYKEAKDNYFRNLDEYFSQLAAIEEMEETGRGDKNGRLTMAKYRLEGLSGRNQIREELMYAYENLIEEHERVLNSVEVNVCNQLRIVK